LSTSEEEKNNKTHTNKIQKQGNLYNNNENSINTRSKKSKVCTFAINTISILLTGRTMASIKYDSKFQVYIEI
jgi:hypothetical protein